MRTHTRPAVPRISAGRALVATGLSLSLLAIPASVFPEPVTGTGVAEAAPHRACPPTVQRGSSGPAVRRLQRILKVPVDGVFGPITEAAVIDLQRAGGLTIDGVVGPQT